MIAAFFGGILGSFVIGLFVGMERTNQLGGTSNGK
jgi:hypothetical protein